MSSVKQLRRRISSEPLNLGSCSPNAGDFCHSFRNSLSKLTGKLPATNLFNSFVFAAKQSISPLPPATPKQIIFEHKNK